MASDVKEARSQRADRRAAIQRTKAAPQLDDLEHWLQSKLSKVSAKTLLPTVIQHALSRLKHLRPYLDHGSLEINNNNPPKRAMRPIAYGRKDYLIMGSACGGRAVAIAYALIETARLNGIDPQIWATRSNESSTAARPSPFSQAVAGAR